MTYSAITPRGIVNIIRSLESSKNIKVPMVYVVENDTARSLVLSLLNERMILVPEVLTIQEFFKHKLYERTGLKNHCNRDKLIDYSIFEMTNGNVLGDEISPVTLKYLAVNALPIINEENLDILASVSVYGQYLKKIREYLFEHKCIDSIQSFGMNVENAPYQVVLISLTGECSSVFKSIYNEINHSATHQPILINIDEVATSGAEERVNDLSCALATSCYVGDNEGFASMLSTMGPEADRKGIVLHALSLIRNGCKDVFVANVRPQDLELIQRELVSAGKTCDISISKKIVSTNIGLVFNSFFGKNQEMNEKLFLSLVSNEAVNIDYGKKNSLQDWITRQYKPKSHILAAELGANSGLCLALLSYKNLPSIEGLDLVISLLDEYIQSIMKKTHSLQRMLDLSATQCIKEMLVELIADYETEKAHVFTNLISPLAAVWRRNSDKNVSAVSGNRAQITLSSDSQYPERMYDGVVIANMTSAEMKVITEYLPENDFLSLCGLGSDVPAINVSKRKFRNLISCAGKKLVIHRPYVSRKGEEEPVSAFYQMVVDAYDENGDGEITLFNANELKSIEADNKYIHLSDGNLENTRFILGKVGGASE